MSVESETDGSSESKAISGTPISPHDRVERVLRANRGKENVIPSRKIADEAGINEGGNYTETKDIIRDLLGERRVPIGANHRGYFLLETRREVEDYVSTLRSRIHEIERRISMVEEAAQHAELVEEET